MDKPNKRQTEKFLEIVERLFSQNGINFDLGELRNILREDYDLYEHYSEEAINEWLVETMDEQVKKGILSRVDNYWCYR